MLDMMKPFMKLLKETHLQNKGKQSSGRIEVISPIRKIPHKDEIFDMLMQLNDGTNTNGLKFTAVDGVLKLNEIKTDINEIERVLNKDASAFLLRYPSTEPTSLETESLCRIICKTLNKYYLPDIETFTNYVINLLSCFSCDIKSKIIKILAALLAKLTGPVDQTLDQIFPNQSKYFNIIDMIVCFFGDRAEHLEGQYIMWRSTRDEKYHNPLFQQIDNDEGKTVTRFF
ncbi:hypothetical protein NQ314_005233 [Rhamnusium bicolor]|uniref:Uncharacterized protein n=1 Tax=Rhamnusium bicolor TaxID=1586634 RepID=A0AAV8ZJR0_9CUCU|nr:hypothetical protein NQ314_005233 [Rhamnusium bicolor]